MFILKTKKLKQKVLTQVLTHKVYRTYLCYEKKGKPCSYLCIFKCILNFTRMHSMWKLNPICLYGNRAHVCISNCMHFLNGFCVLAACKCVSGPIDLNSKLKNTRAHISTLCSSCIFFCPTAVLALDDPGKKTPHH